MNKKKVEEASKKERRSNLWAFLIYPGDSAPDNYMNLLENLHIPVAVSPLHDPDPKSDPDKEGDAGKKKHRHIMIYFGQGQNKSFEQVQDLIKDLNGTRPFQVQSMNGMIRYFIHFDNPEKQREDEKGKKWTEESITLFSGFQIGDAFGSFVEDEQYYKYIEEVIVDHKIVDLASLIIFLKEMDCMHEVSFVRRHTYYIDRFLDGMYRRVKKQEDNKKEA